MFIIRMVARLGLPVCYYFYFSSHYSFCHSVLRIARIEFMCVQIVERKWERRSINYAVEYIILICKYLIRITILILLTTIIHLAPNNHNHQVKHINIILINLFQLSRLLEDFNHNRLQEVHLVINH
jgi:hypothetical protein